MWCRRGISGKVYVEFVCTRQKVMVLVLRKFLETYQETQSILCL
ncbi:hypothetical protein GBAR_LOCUS26925 [Geodia barretti]|uniref:Uncharacterized protein n=1 Tax=Geodia barretti TaxID=519541 RepID=A0AA35XDY7_GEOBA|nr:hypothetical protein GBAR_LOCUS26925 [Geodia barretti]